MKIWIVVGNIQISFKIKIFARGKQVQFSIRPFRRKCFEDKPISSNEGHFNCQAWHSICIELSKRGINGLDNKQEKRRNFIARAVTSNFVKELCDNDSHLLKES